MANEVTITVEGGLTHDRQFVQEFIFLRLQWKYILVRTERYNGQFVIEAFPPSDPTTAMG